MLKDEPVPEGYMRYRFSSVMLLHHCSQCMLKDEPVRDLSTCDVIIASSVPKHDDTKKRTSEQRREKHILKI
jgi:hypothetical protein